MEQKADTDTIAAIATPIGQGGIGIIRISGPESLEILKRLFRPKRPVEQFKSHRLYLGHIFDPGTGMCLDEVLATYMKAPRTYTKEDVVEVNSHSGYFILSKILELVLESGARIAQPGEFTLRAYLNGRIDLTQAEAVVDLINSRSERGLYLASEQIRGSLRDKINALTDQLIQILGQIEAAIDFPDEEDTFLDREGVVKILSDLITQITSLIDAHSEKKTWIEGISTVIAGRVNVGKSSLLNRILDEQRAIVTAIPGTTRDVIESILSIEGVPVRLMDTAGIRQVTDDEVEKIGVQLTEERLKEADLVLAVLDQSLPLSPEDIQLLEKIRHKTALLVLNKIDLAPAIDWNQALKDLPPFPTLKVSALTGEGIPTLKKEIVRLVIGTDKDLDPSGIAPNIRQTRALKEARKYLESALQAITEGTPLEISAFELRNALDSLGEIVGETTPEHVLESIFSRFCIGK